MCRLGSQISLQVHDFYSCHMLLTLQYHRTSPRIFLPITRVQKSCSTHYNTINCEWCDNVKTVKRLILKGDTNLYLRYYSYSNFVARGHLYVFYVCKTACIDIGHVLQNKPHKSRLSFNVTHITIIIITNTCYLLDIFRRPIMHFIVGFST